MNPNLIQTDMLKGYLWMALAVVIWAGWLVLTSSGRTTGLSVVDLAGLRALFPAILLAPVLWARRHEVAQLGVTRCLLLSAYGAPFTLCVGLGLGKAPVAHASALVPGLMPLLAAAICAVFFGASVQRHQIIGYLLILITTLSVFIFAGGPFANANVFAGHVLFLIGACCWACFAATSKTFDISPFLATAIVGGVSSALILPVWVFSGYSTLGLASWSEILFQSFFQGIASGLLSLFAFTRALRLIGYQASMLASLTPGVATLLAVPALGQVPNGIELFALFLVILGLLISSTGGRPASTPKNATAQNY